jgi:hypothetical protein
LINKEVLIPPDEFQYKLKTQWVSFTGDEFIKNKISFYYFITGLDRKSFDNKHVTFEDHIRKVHNMWNYVYFMVLIHVKDPTEYTGPESYVHEMIEVRYIFLLIENQIYKSKTFFFF